MGTPPSTSFGCSLTSFAIVNSLICSFCFFFLALFLRNFDWIKLELQDRKSFNQDLANLDIGVDCLMSLSIIFFMANILCVKHQFDWQSLMDKSWCSLNHFARQKRLELDE